ncbi:hypothetical protein [Saccharopolyspora shandongensis]|uniref:hypothetical protein n=1 Tax=Saccharopolyspora shandongensis TaxID=418495 RepID=UPI0033E7E526
MVPDSRRRREPCRVHRRHVFTRRRTVLPVAKHLTVETEFPVMAERHSWAANQDERTGIVQADDARLALGALITPGTTPVAARTGLRPAPGNPGLVSTSSPTPDGRVTVAAFQHIMRSRGTGPYIQTLDAPKMLDILATAPADPANPRHDLVIAQQSDTAYRDPTTAFVVRHVVGIPAVRPNDPPVDGSPDYVVLARIRIAPRANAITAEMIDDLRPDWTVALGGVLPIRDLTERIELTQCAFPGLTIYRRDRKWLEAWDGESWRVVGTVSTANPADITDPYVDQLIFNSRDRTLYRWAGEWIPVAGDAHGKGLVHARRRAQGATIASVITAETPIYQHSVPVQPSRVYRISARVPVIASEAGTTTRVRIKAGTAYITESGETVCPTAGNAVGVSASTVYVTDPSQALLALTVSVERVAGRGALTVTVDREFPLEILVEDLGGIPELVER